MALHFGSVLANLPTAQTSEETSSEPVMQAPPWVTDPRYSTEDPEQATSTTLAAAEQRPQHARVRAKSRKQERKHKTGYAPTRPLFLQMVEKLRAIAEHRLCVSGWYDEESDDEEEETDSMCGENDTEDGEIYEDDGENEDLLMEETDEIDGEERRRSDSTIDEDTESDLGSEIWEGSDDDDSLVETALDEGVESDATWAIICTADKADYLAGVLLRSNKNGLLRGSIDDKMMSANAVWVQCKKTYCSYIKALHAGCDKVLDYNPLMTAVFEMVVGWSMRRMELHKVQPKNRSFVLELGMGRIQEELAERKAEKRKEAMEEKDFALTLRQRNAINWGFGDRWARRGGKARK